MKPCSAVAESSSDSPIAQTQPLPFTDTRGAAEPQAAQGADSQNIPNSRGVN